MIGMGCAMHIRKEWRFRAPKQSRINYIYIYIKPSSFCLKHPEVLRILEHSIPTTTINIDNWIRCVTSIQTSTLPA